MVLLLEIYPTDILIHLPKDSCTRWLIVWTGTDRKRPKCPTVRLTQVHTAIKQMRSQLQSLPDPSGNVEGWGRGSSTHPPLFYPHAQAHKMRCSEGAFSLRRSGSTSQHPVTRCDCIHAAPQNKLLCLFSVYGKWTIMQTTQQQLCFHPLGDPDVTTIKCNLPKTAHDVPGSTLQKATHLPPRERIPGLSFFCRCDLPCSEQLFSNLHPKPSEP